ncbi:uncharacterized protein E0L32_003627 [Thyridium curvatum]|uniref:Uncharacterized protein n=1 Tax=Thyridium curvatum TaxID=1093900 RepID=A0A507BBT2_9PEZI|nr:uncharacterized protein E0L32_003627 [Thyridium curvatum]TPX16686.1 hypothetical protein E0L32_003627 [Thyridium curvatum]
MASPHSSSPTLPRLVFSQPARRDGPKTPEPFASAPDASLSSPPRPRFKLKRRNVPHLSAPTQHFLASVAAADVPIPSIEEPEIASLDSDMIDTYPGMSNFPDDEDMALLAIRGRTFSPPKTPAPGIVPSLSPSRYPNWTIDSSFTSSAESSPEPSRPSTSRSTQTSASLFSGLSQFSDDSHCVSPETDNSDKFVCVSSDDGFDALPGPSKRSSRKAPWTKAMSAHLWSTYILYLQDPKVTPFRIGKSCVPPHGVCLRVAREARRSWKGARAFGNVAAPVAPGTKSGSSTPTAESSGTYMEWPHTCAATRAHLRDLCKLKASTPGVRSFHHMSRSPTPFTQAATRHWNRRTTPAGLASAFGTQDMALSLTASTSEAMQPQGPLAQLTGSGPQFPPSSPPPMVFTFPGPGHESEASAAERRRLGSPFTARSYGPSSSAPLAAVLGLTTNTRQPHTVGPRRTLQSPVRLSRSGTQKRRSKQGHEARKRPSLASDIFVDPSIAITTAPTEASLGPAFSSTSTARNDELFIPRSPMGSLTTSSTAPQLSTKSLAPPEVPPPRLGSPFRGHGHSSSFSFPNRFSQPITLDIEALGRPFSTVRQPVAAAETSSPPPRTDLASRLAYIDQRLKEFRSRDITRRRSESPL